MLLCLCAQITMQRYKKKLRFANIFAKICIYDIFFVPLQSAMIW